MQNAKMSSLKDKIEAQAEVRAEKKPAKEAKKEVKKVKKVKKNEK